MSNENLLCDLESDIDRDWEEIQHSVNNKKIKKELEKELDSLKDRPLRMKFPHFAEFYEMMFMIFRSYRETDEYIPYEVMKMLDRMFYRYGDEPEMSPAFDYVWGMFCDPQEYAFHTFRCNHCNNKWDAVFKRIDNRIFASYSEGYAHYTQPTTASFYRITCPNCSNIIGNLTNELLGLFKHKELSKEDILDKEKYRQFLKEGGYDIR